MKKSFLIKDDDNNSRLDRWFKRNVCSLPQSLIEKNLRRGNIKVNNKKGKSSYKLKKDDIVDVHNINFTPNKSNQKLERYTANKKDLEFSSTLFIENNKDFAVINKPAGIAVQSGTKSKKNIIDILRSTKEFEGFLPFSVHRIDKETTGIFIVAKNRKYAQLLTSLFRIRKIHKTYLGVVLGEMDQSKGKLIDELIYQDGKKVIKAKAITYFEVIDSNNNYSLLKLNPETGRKHQIRKQLLMRGHPILGDTKYRFLDSKRNRKNALMLHAYKIKFSVAGSRFNFLANPPLQFIKVLKEKFLKIS